MSSPFTIVTPCSKRWADLHGDGDDDFVRSAKRPYTPSHNILEMNGIKCGVNQAGGYAVYPAKNRGHRAAAGELYW